MLLRSLTLAAAGLLLCAVPASAASYSVAVRDDYYGPGLLAVRKGDRVTWTNRGSSPHTVSTRRWSVTLNPGQSYSRRIYRTWSYHCKFHSGMAGKVRCKNC